MANGGPQQRRRIIGLAVVAALALVGLGVGIGAVVWSGSSSAEPAPPQATGPAVTAPSLTAKNNSSSPRAKVGNYNVPAIIYFEGLPEGGVTMNLSPASDSHCTTDETYGDFHVTNASAQGIKMWVLSDLDEGSCFYQRSWNTWKVSLPGGGGELGVFEGPQGVGARYHALCSSESSSWDDGDWTGGWSCRSDDDALKFWITKS